MATKVKEHLKTGEKDRRRIAKGLSSKRKYIPSVYFYDKKGSELFEKITSLEEYYQPDIEKDLLRTVAKEIRGELQDVDIVELGSGDCSKISILLAEVPKEKRKTVRYVALDVSASALEKSCRDLSGAFGDIEIEAIVADFLTQLHLLPQKRRKIICFFGSTLGNFPRERAAGFLSELAEKMMPGDILLLGLDNVKEKEILERAYNDGKGITANFNKNILNAVNRHLGTHFLPGDFEHVAVYDEELDKIEMRLRAKREMELQSPHLEKKIRIKKGEEIHTEDSHKFKESHIKELAKGAGLKVKDISTDENAWFSLVRLVR